MDGDEFLDLMLGHERHMQLRREQETLFARVLGPHLTDDMKLEPYKHRIVITRAECDELGMTPVADGCVGAYCGVPIYAED